MTLTPLTGTYGELARAYQALYDAVIARDRMGAASEPPGPLTPGTALRSTGGDLERCLKRVLAVTGAPPPPAAWRQRGILALSKGALDAGRIKALISKLLNVTPGPPVRLVGRGNSRPTRMWASLDPSTPALPIRLAGRR